MPGVSVPPPVSAAQRSVLYAVRRRGEATVTDVAEMLDMTPSGARQHLTGLADAGLLEAGEAARVPGQQGRTERIYCIAPAAEPLFPRAYGELTNQLLGYVPAGAVAAAFEHRRDDRIDGARRPVWPASAASPPRSPSWRRSSTRTATWRRSSRSADGAYRIAERNCAIFAVAREHPQACSTELEFLRAALPEADIERVTHMMAGAHSCSYEIRPRSDPSVSRHRSACGGAAPRQALGRSETLGWGAVRCRAGSWGPRW